MKEKLKESIIKSVTELDENKSLSLVKKALRYGIPMYEIAEYLQQGMSNVGQLFESEEYFIGDLIMAGIIFKEVMKLDEENAIVNETTESKGVILIGTVEGDIHDIGKDIFIGMACVNGFKVVDLGVDVKAEMFVEKIKEIKPDILGMSGLLAEAKKQVMATISAIVKEGLRDNIKIIVGGGLMKESDETEMIYADAYVKNSQKGLNICLNWANNGYK